MVRRSSTRIVLAIAEQHLLALTCVLPLSCQEGLPMIRSFRTVLTASLFSLAAVAALAPCLASAADGLPYRGTLDLNIIDVYPSDSGTIIAVGTLDGTANHLGKLHGMVMYEIDPTTGAFVGTAYKIAANGDVLYESLAGQFLDPDMINSVGTFSFEGGTGHFANASGDGVFSSTFTSTTHGTVDVDALLSYDASDRAN
jgi:hypothetical protein